MGSAVTNVAALAETLMLGPLLERVRETLGSYELLHHWKQGEFHHDVVIKVNGAAGDLPGDFLVVATNCNGGVKEVLCFEELPGRLALWHYRCPENPDFRGVLPPLLDQHRTVHWFDPCELLHADARSELRAEFRERQTGGGWQRKDSPN